MRPFQKLVSLLFFTCMIIFIAGEIMGERILMLIFKPILLPLLIVLLVTATRNSASRMLLIAALFFSFVGDVLLLLEYKWPVLFIPGLLAFLTTHILYIIYFLRLPGKAPSLLRQQPWLVLMVLAYGALLLYLLFPTLGALKIPVAIYATVIMTMMLAALHISRRVSSSVAALFITGALFFVASDSILAINKFYAPVALPGLIMLTYCIAQFLLVRGFMLALTERDAVD